MGGAVFQEHRTRVWGPPVGLGRPLRRVARPAEHGAVADVERRATGCERHDVIGGQVSCRVGVALVARAGVAVLPDMPGDHPLGQACPSRVGVDPVVGTDAREPCVLSAATARAAGDDTTDRADLHPRIVDGVGGPVYSPAVLHLRDQANVIDLAGGLGDDPHGIAAQHPAVARRCRLRTLWSGRAGARGRARDIFNFAR